MTDRVVVTVALASATLLTCIASNLIGGSRKNKKNIEDAEEKKDPEVEKVDQVDNPQQAQQNQVAPTQQTIQFPVNGTEVHVPPNFTVVQDPSLSPVTVSTN